MLDIEVIDDSGRERINMRTQVGRMTYRNRVLEMRARQHDKCCVCKTHLPLSQATFEHEEGRNPRFRDDRTSKEVDGKIKLINGASHLLCNSERGSRRTKIWHGEQE